METRVETLADLKKIRFGQYGTIFCKETEREYYFEPNGGSLTPDDLDVVLPVQGGNARLVAHKAFASGGGGGASAYPEQVTFITSPGTTTLTLAQQGIIFQISGIVQLPSAAPDGTTYKIAGGPNDVRIDTNGAPVLGYGSGIFRPGRIPIVLKALNIPSLAWSVENKNTYPNWYSDAAYGLGDRVEVAGVVYESRSDSNIGNNPVTAPNWWRRLTPISLSGVFSVVGLL